MNAGADGHTAGETPAAAGRTPISDPPADAEGDVRPGEIRLGDARRSDARRSDARRSDARRIPVTLVTGPSAHLRENAIARVLRQAQGEGRSAIILEGLPDGTSTLDSSNENLIARIAPGCLCCAGNLVMRVTLNRLLRQRPQRLFIGVAEGTHLDQLRSWLSNAPYDQLLALTADLGS